MNIQQPLTELYREAGCNQADAVDFLFAWHAYCHELDDVVDNPLSPETPEMLLASQVRAACLYTCPFFQQNAAALRPLVFLIASAWGDSVKFEHSGDSGLRTYGDSLRLVGNEMVCAVALICGGFAHLRRISPRLRKLAWANQHAPVGEQEP